MTISGDHSGDDLTGMVKIGVVAKQLGISIRTIHMYERERLFIAHKNHAGTRLFSEKDIAWLIEVRKMIKSSISIAGIRSLLAQIPCWDATKCSFVSRQECPSLKDNDYPCWSNKKSKCFQSIAICRQCKVYEMRFHIRDFKRHMMVSMRPDQNSPRPDGVTDNDSL
ncbi:MAG: MerR family transcriptional regulator [Magnetococcales bacterium]|nr:MerR family transcriptional regulator [Magnetococcales bacterium]